MSVKRYKVGNRALHEAKDGNVVNHSDYTALRAQLAAVTAERDEARLDVKDWSDRAYAAEHKLTTATERAEKAEAEIVKARKYGALSVMGLLMKWAQKLGGTISLGLTIDETTGQPTGATLDVLHGDGEKYGALISLPDGEKIIPADVEARAVAHWAECEAWRTWNDRPSGERFEKVEDAREASDRARGVPAPAENPRG